MENLKVVFKNSFFFSIFRNVQTVTPKKPPRAIRHNRRIANARSSLPEMFSGKGVLKTCSKFTGEHPSRRVILIRLQSNFIEITLQDEGSPAN